jgi:hypothetical protein
MNKKFAQMDPAAAPPMDPMAMGGAPPMDPMAMGMGGPPAMPMAAPGAPPTSREEIGSPLDSLGKILYDVDITTLLLSRIGDSSEDTSLYVWLMYGGDEHGGSMKDRVGKRAKKKDVKKDQEKAEQERTEDSRWERLPAGKKITDITSLDEMTPLDSIVEIYNSANWWERETWDMFGIFFSNSKIFHVGMILPKKLNVIPKFSIIVGRNGELLP